MAIEKQRVIDRFNPKFGTVSMPKQKLDAIAAKFATLIADGATDEDIDSFLDTMNEAHSFKDIAADEHRKANPPKPNPPKPDPSPADPQPNPSPVPAPAPADQPPAWAIALVEEVKSLKAEKQQTNIQAKAKALFTEKNVPEEYWALAPLPATEEELGGYVDGLATKYTAFVQQNFNGSVGNYKPAYGTGGAGKKEASKEEVDAVIAKMNIPTT